MTKIITLALCAALAGCAGSDKPSPEERLEGTWGAERDGCATTYSFDGTRYAIAFTCELQGGGFGMEIDRGDFEADDTEVGFKPDRSSCPEKVIAGKGSYRVQGDTLTLSGDKSALVLKRVPEGAPDTGASVEFGCWDGDTFTPGSVEKL